MNSNTTILNLLKTNGFTQVPNKDWPNTVGDKLKDAVDSVWGLQMRANKWADVFVVSLDDGDWKIINDDQIKNIGANTIEKELTSLMSEEYGAGFEGTNELRNKYIKDTPGQRIQQFKTEMKQYDYQEFEAQHKKMYPSHTTDQIKAAYKKYSEYIEVIQNIELEEAEGKTVESAYNDLSKMSDSALRGILRRMDIDDYNIIKDQGREDIIAEILMSKFGEKEALEFLENPDNFKMEEAFGESWVVYNKDTKAKIKPFKTRKGAYEYAAKNGGVVYSGEYYHDHQDDINSGKLVKEESLDEAQNLVSKGIYTFDGKKIDGARSSKLFLQALDSDGFLHNLSWKEWSESDLEDTSADSTKKQFVDRLAKEIKVFNKRIDLNTWLKGGDRSFTDTVNYIFKLDPNIKYAKASGLKEESLQEAVTPKEISQIKNEFDMELIPQSKWAKNYQDNVRTVKQLYGISQGNGEYDDVYFVIYDDENKPYGVVDIEGITMYAKFSAAKAGLKISLNSMKESLQESRDFKSFSKENLILWLQTNWTSKKVSPQFRQELDAAVREAQSRGLYRHIKIEPQKTDTVQEAVPAIDVEELLKRAVDLRNDNMSLRKGQAIMIELLKMDRKVYDLAVQKADAFYLDSKIPALIKFLDPNYYEDEGEFAESYNVQEAVLKVGTFVTLSNGKVGKVTNVSGDKEIVDIKLNDGRQVSVTMDKVISSMSEAINIRDYMATSEKSQFGGYRPKVVGSESGKVMYLGQALYYSHDEAKDHAEDYLKQYARGISEPRVPSKGTYDLKEQNNESVDFRTMKDANLKQWLKRNDTDDSVSAVFGAQILAAKKEAKRRGISAPRRLKEEKESYDSWIIKPRDGGESVKIKAPDESSAIEIALGRKPSQHEIDFFNFHYILIQEKTNVSTLRNMKIVELATNCHDEKTLKEYVEQQYESGSSVLAIKESFKKFVSNK